MPRTPAMITPPGFVLYRFEIRGEDHYDRYGRRFGSSPRNLFIHIPEDDATNSWRASNYALTHSLMTRDQAWNMIRARRHYCQTHRYMCSCRDSNRRNARG